MTNPPIHDLNLTDTEYAAMLTKGYDPILEEQLIALGENPTQARKISVFMGQLKKNPRETPENWEELLNCWEDTCGYRPNFSE